LQKSLIKIYKDEKDKYPTDWSADGQFITYTTVDDPETKWDIWIVPMNSDQNGIKSEPYPFLQTEFFEGPAKFSPDGKWIAYSSDESGQDEVYVRPFPGPGGKWQISAGGGFEPYWREDGKEIFYEANGKNIMAVSVKSNHDIFEVGAARRLFDLPSGADVRAVTRDGQRFILRVPVQDKTEQPLTLVANWDKELEKN